jgi:hypothetical protein
MDLDAAAVGSKPGAFEVGEPRANQADALFLDGAARSR